MTTAMLLPSLLGVMLITRLPVACPLTDDTLPLTAGPVVPSELLV
jgi:hypothetical protein